MNAEIITSALKTGTFGRPLHWYSTIDSTNNRARELAAEGAQEGTLVIADQQTAGRGRLGRSWESDAGTSLLFSLILTPHCSPGMAGIVPLAAAVAVVRGIIDATELRPECKWPNDLLMSGKKLCGILSESIVEGQSLRAIIVGIGINVNQFAFTEELSPAATSLAIEAKHPFDRTTILVSVLKEFERIAPSIRDDSRSILSSWKKMSGMFGKPVMVSGAGPVIEGIAQDLAPNGALLVRTAGGTVETVLAGDVTLRTKGV